MSRAMVAGAKAVLERLKPTAWTLHAIDVTADGEIQIVLYLGEKRETFTITPLVADRLSSFLGIDYGGFTFSAAPSGGGLRVLHLNHERDGKARFAWTDAAKVEHVAEVGRRHRTAFESAGREARAIAHQRKDGGR